MPVMSGEAFIQQVREHNQTVPFIFTSAFVLGADENRLLSLSANAFVAKPINVSRLFLIIEQCIGLQYEYLHLKGEQNKPLLTPQQMKNTFKQLPTQQQDTLRQHANNGNIKQIRNLAGFMKQDKEWQDLGEHICEMVAKYDMDGLSKLFSTDTEKT